MHILFFNPQGNFDDADSHLTEHPDFGGQLVYVKELAKAMVDAGHRVDIVTRQIVDANWPEFAAQLDHYSGYEQGLRILRMPCGGDAFLPKEQLWDHMAEFLQATIDFFADDLPDFVTAHYADGGYCAALMQERTGLPFTFTGHSLGGQKMDKLGETKANAEAMERRFRFSRRIDAERLSMERACRIITSTRQERLEQYAHPLYAGAVDVEDGRRFATVPPGVNTRVFGTEPSKLDDQVSARIKARVGTPEQPQILVSSRVDRKKNIAGTVEAWVRCQALHERAGLVICLRGIDDPYATPLQLPAEEREVLEPVLTMISEAGLRDRVSFLDIRSQAELAATYRFFARRGSVFTLTAFYEPFGLAPIEAAACGLACVATRNGGPSEIFADGSGVLVDPFDAQDIANGLVMALDKHEELSRQASRRVRAMYTWEQTAQGYLSVIREGITAQSADQGPVPPLDASARIEDYLD